MARQRKSDNRFTKPSMTTVVTVLLACAAAYLLAAGAAFLLQRKMLYYPEPAMVSPSAAGVPEMRAVETRTEDGLTLTAWYAAAPKGAPTIVLFHGNAGNLSHRAFKARLLIDAGFGVLLAGYRGYGGNPGSPTEAGLYADGRAALAYLKDAGVAPGTVVLYGESLGSGVATKLAAEQAAAGTPVKAVMLEAPFTSIPDVAAHHYRILPFGLILRDRFDNKARIRAIGAPLFILHGRKDEVIPFLMGEALLAAARAPKDAAWIDGAHHNDLFEHGAGARVLAFLGNLTK